MNEATLHILTHFTDSATTHVVALDIPVDHALWHVDSSRKVARDTQGHQTTDRDGNSVHVFYAYLVGSWKGVDHSIQIVSIPTSALIGERP
ncbi:hypothetical protein [Streptomyces sp. NPDC002057]|uniref:hypothetical protein n=1 Tax=Streptomyces sp. NPDC002057 TaxID=3154664 RepID=UPI003325C5F9